MMAPPMQDNNNAIPGTFQQSQNPSAAVPPPPPISMMDAHFGATVVKRKRCRAYMKSFVT